MRKEIEIRLKLKEILERRGITQRELAFATGIREATLSEMVNETRNVINKKNLAIVMQELNIHNLEDIIELKVRYVEEKDPQ